MSGHDAIDKLTRLDWIARAGLAARGVTYLLLGLIVLQAGAHSTEGQNGAFAALQEVPSGALLLGITALGLFAFGLFRVSGAVFDIERNGTRPIGIINRFGQFALGATYFVLAFSAGEVAIGLRRVDPSYGYRSSRFLAEKLLAEPLGPVLLGGVGIGFLVSAVLTTKNAIRARHMRFCVPSAPTFVTHIGRAGMFTQAALAIVIGWSMLRAAWFEDAAHARALGGALGLIHSHTLLYNAIGVGLMMFGAFSLLLVRYQIVPPIDVVDAARDKAEHAIERIA